MRKAPWHVLVVILISLLVITLMISCVQRPSGTGSSASASSSNITSPYESRPTSDSSETDTNFLNISLLQLIRGSNMMLKNMVDSEGNRACIAYNVGLRTDTLIYTGPYLQALFVSEGEEGWDSAKKTLVDAGPVYPENPFVDYLTINKIILLADIEQTTRMVTDQLSLKQLFTTDNIITYELLKKELQQDSILEHMGIAVYSGIGETTALPESAPIVEFEIDVYEALYTISDLEIRVQFIQEGDSYMAFRVSIYDKDTDWYIE